MGFWKDLCKGIKDGAKELWEDTKWAARELASDISRGLKKASEWIDNLGKKKSGPKIDTTFPGTSTNSINEEDKKRKRERENEAITQYQQQIEERAKSREKDVKNAYLKIYAEYIAAFEKVFGNDIISSIKNYVNDKSLSFANTLRDEVNTKVNSSYQPWKQLISMHPSAKQLQDYCDKVYTDADNNLLDSLQSAIEETNKFISKCINKYNDDKATALSEMKHSLINLTADEETMAQELKKIAEELVVAQFIYNEASIEA